MSDRRGPLVWLAALLLVIGAWFGSWWPFPSPGPPPAPGPTVPTATPMPTSTPTTNPTPSPSPTGTPAPASGPTPGEPPDRWVPSAQVTWQWQLTGELDLGVDAQVYDVDLFDTPAAQVAALRALGRQVICYVSAGTYEPWRPDSADFPAEVIGAPLEDWPDERWVDVRRLDVLLPVMAARMDLCVQKGFDAVEPDNVDAWVNDSGFDLTAEDQAVYNRELARLAHERGLAVGLKNDVEQAGLLEPVFDFAVNEECVMYEECELLLPFVRAGKPVLHVEYELDPEEFCTYTRSLGFSSTRKSFDLDVSRTAC